MQRQAIVVVVLGTGGTIAGRAATPVSTAYDSAQIGIGELVAALPAAASLEVESEQVAQLDSKDMDFATWRRLALAIERHLARSDVAGVVVTHGTDTLEETACFLARVVASDKPVVLTAAMRPATSFEADGPRNLADAIAVAGSPGAAGVVVVLAGEIHAASGVHKTHPRRLDAFSSGEAGPIGRVAAGHVEMREAWPVVARVVSPERLPQDAAAWPWVEIVASAAGADGRAVDALADRGVAGLVVAATGNGTLHALLAIALADARRLGVAVVRSTRCLEGPIGDGDGAAWPPASALVPSQARVEMILALLAACSADRPPAAP